MSKHTKGPWTVHKVDSTVVIDKHGGDVAVASGDYETEHEAMEANARLIAAAPELLEALKQIAEGLENTRSHPGQYMTKTTKDQACRMAIAAIAKAENRT